MNIFRHFLSRWRSRPPIETAPAPGLRVYAIGDIHGENGLLDRLAAAIAADLEREPPADARAIFLGDYVDRGPDTAGVLERLATARFPIPFTALRGNHEDLMLRAMEAPDAAEHWYGNGGLATIASYGLDVAKALGGKGLGKLRRAFIETWPAHHRAFVEGTELSATVGGYFFCHAGARPGVPLDRQDPHDLMWIRDACYQSDFDFGKVLVHGHTPHRAPENLERRINVDTGAFKWGTLTAVALEGSTRRFIAVRA